MSAGEAGATTPRRRVWPWVVSFAIVAALVVGAWFAGEAIARDVVVGTVREEVRTNLALPADQQIDVEVPGLIIPQLLGGRLDEVRIAADDVPVDQVIADIVVDAKDVPLGGGDVRDARATVRIDEEQLPNLLQGVEGFPVDEIGIDAPDITAQTELSVFGLGVPIALSLTPTVEDGMLVLSPASIEVAGAEVTADAVRRQFGVVAEAVLRDWPVCVAQYLPAGLTLVGVGVDVTESAVVATFDIADTMLSDASLRERGSC
ncbi:LmeA family phospholipid-binding protein [Microbacterium koreense]|uniref:LmeA family phospholipid-binding protein n=1 Tax=Microbacterium koreense TaxID=323761 RepID=A0ABW2ZUN2_9MICO